MEVGGVYSVVVVLCVCECVCVCIETFSNLERKAITYRAGVLGCGLTHYTCIDSIVIILYLPESAVHCMD